MICTVNEKRGTNRRLQKPQSSFLKFSLKVLLGDEKYISMLALYIYIYIKKIEFLVSPPPGSPFFLEFLC